VFVREPDVAHVFANINYTIRPAITVQQVGVEYFLELQKMIFKKPTGDAFSISPTYQTKNNNF
jgi:hypothetical protein